MREFGRTLPVPRAILAISAHWCLESLQVTRQVRPETIHDFGGFPRELFDVRYPAPGSPELADKVAALLAAEGAESLEAWGLDHGAWSVLVHLFPDAEVPVVQLSLDATRHPAAQVDIGRKLSVLREDGVLIVASGNVVHNLAHAMRSMSTGDPRTPEWAARFDERTAGSLLSGDEDALVGLERDVEFRLAHPSADHWLPLLVAFGASRREDAVSFPVAGFDLGSLSMRSVRWG